MIVLPRQARDKHTKRWEKKDDAFLLQDKSCSGHGQCDSVFGTCVCNTNFFGEDCSVRKTPFWSNLYVFE
jgi:hypothetical protein